MVLTWLNNEKPRELTINETINTGFGPHLSIKFPTRGEITKDEKAP
ncbi:unannotated protein [freshwater metagenome]|uniref:Unannotated protein n=1 Tax=freshwater metagenome TaxID=449393 RepID=A0A6J6KQD3_9ZZZZ